MLLDFINYTCKRPLVTFTVIANWNLEGNILLEKLNFSLEQIVILLIWGFECLFHTCKKVQTCLICTQSLSALTGPSTNWSKTQLTREKFKCVECVHVMKAMLDTNVLRFCCLVAKQADKAYEWMVIWTVRFAEIHCCLNKMVTFESTAVFRVSKIYSLYSIKLAVFATGAPALQAATTVNHNYKDS